MKGTEETRKSEKRYIYPGRKWIRCKERRRGSEIENERQRERERE